jgi:carbon-monoxide dehydrogenase large subunit
MVALAAYTAHNLPDGMEPGLKETAFYDPTNFTFPGRRLYLRARGRSGPGKLPSSTSWRRMISAG